MSYVYVVDLDLGDGQPTGTRTLYFRDLGCGEARWVLVDLNAGTRLEGWWVAGHTIGEDPSGMAFSAMRNPQRPPDALFVLQGIQVQTEPRQPSPGIPRDGHFNALPPIYRSLGRTFHWSLMDRQRCDAFPSIFPSTSSPSRTRGGCDPPF
jgi:hypothetical protein